MSTEQQHLHTVAVSHIHQCFNRIKKQAEQAGKEVAAYYFYLVDDFFAAGNAAITYQDLAAFTVEHADEYENCTILQAIWDGRCTLYDSETEPQNVSDNVLKTVYCCLRFILMIMMKMTNNHCFTVPPLSSTNRILTKN